MNARNDHARHEATRGGRSGHRRARRRRGRAWRGLATIGVLLLLAIVVVPLIPPDGDGTRAAARPRGGRPADVGVSLEPRGQRLTVPPSFLGLSTEYWAMPRFERHLRVFERLLALLHVPGDAPFVLRVGGDSADHTFWEPRLRRMPRWVFGLTPRWLSLTRALVRHTHLRLIVDLNLLTDSPFTAARWARVAYDALPRLSVAGFEIGNEPDIYSRNYWLAIIARSGFGARILPLRLSASQYASDFITYANTIHQISPAVPLLGPALANPLRDAYWLKGLLASAHGDLGVVTAHRYPLSACVKPRSPVYPTIARILSERSSAGMATAVRAAVRIAHGANLPLRMTEMNSVTCGGRRGVSNSFATALWAPDALFELLRAGVDGVNVHVRPDAVNAAFILRRSGLGARPLLYGLIMFDRAIGPGARLLPLRIGAPSDLNLKVWATRTRRSYKVLLIDKGRQSAIVSLRIPGTARASVQRLTAPSVASPSGVTLDGQQLGRDGRWHGPRDTQMIAPRRGVYRVTVPGISAALVRIPA